MIAFSERNAQAGMRLAAKSSGLKIAFSLKKKNSRAELKVNSVQNNYKNYKWPRNILFILQNCKNVLQFCNIYFLLSAILILTHS